MRRLALVIGMGSVSLGIARHSVAAMPRRRRGNLRGGSRRDIRRSTDPDAKSVASRKIRHPAHWYERAHDQHRRQQRPEASQIAS